jgi:hypothetical protein
MTEGITEGEIKGAAEGKIGAEEGGMGANVG